MRPLSDLTAENVSAVFIDSLATEDDPEESIVIAEGIRDDSRFRAKQLHSHVLEVELMLSHVSTSFYDDRGGGHTCLDLELRRDGHCWGTPEDASRLLALGLGLNLISYCRDRMQWFCFPSAIPYVEIKGRLFKLWARFRCISGADLTLSFAPESYLPPEGVADRTWYDPLQLAVGTMSDHPRHVSEAFYQDLVVLGFFDKDLPSWILDQGTLLQVY